MLSHSIPERSMRLPPFLRPGCGGIESAQTCRAMPRWAGDGHLQAIVTKHLFVRQPQRSLHRRSGVVVVASAVSRPTGDFGNVRGFHLIYISVKQDEIPKSDVTAVGKRSASRKAADRHGHSLCWWMSEARWYWPILDVEAKVVLNA